MAAGSTYTPIATTTLGSTTASYTFSSIPSTYTDLVLVVIGEAYFTSTNYINTGVQFNSDTGSNYAAHYLIGNGSSVSSGATTTSNISYTPWIPGANKSANVFGA